ncbi:ABC transporter ATP-binding protein [Rothia sp. P7181]|uniref:ABC transporter ATP-binding protein n=1 Tax=Rothia sp. P7181 TaxID=3402663 RepID=UPI003ADE4626
MLEVHELTKRYGAKKAVDNISFSVPDGKVTGFLGPNGAGKSTTMRMIVGLEKPTSGQALVEGKLYKTLTSPVSSVGALLDAKAVHPGRSAIQHLRSLALTHGISKKRVDEVIELTGLSAVAHKKVRGFSLGMGQRLGIAVALLGDPHNLIFDEPVNGLDPEGVIWVRHLARHLASEGRCVLISSHLMSEMSQTADELIVIGQGKILAHSSIKDFLARSANDTVLVRTDDREQLGTLLRERQITIESHELDGLIISGSTAREIAKIAQENNVLLHELTPQISTLEDVYMELTKDSIEYSSNGIKPSHQKELYDPVGVSESIPQATRATMFEDNSASVAPWSKGSTKETK